MSLPDLLAAAVVLVVTPALWAVAVLLWRMAREAPHIKVLGHDAFTAVWLAMVVTIFAVVFLNNGMEKPVLDLHATQLLTRSAILSLAIPALRGLLLFYRDSE